MKKLILICMVVLCLSGVSYGSVTVTEVKDGSTWTYTLTNNTDSTIWMWAVWFDVNPGVTSVTTDTDGWVCTNLATQGYFPEEYVEYWGDVEVTDSAGEALVGPAGEGGFYQVYAGDFVSANPKEYDETFDAFLGGKSGWDGIGADIKTSVGIKPGESGTLTVVVSLTTAIATSFSYNTTEYWYSKTCLSNEDLAVDFEGHGTVGIDPKIWNVPEDYDTIQEAIDDAAVLDGDTILVLSGTHAGALVTKAVEILGEDGAVINSGPLPWTTRSFMAGFLFPGSGAGNGTTISNLAFETVEFPVFSRGADNVTVENCTMNSPIQGITNWEGSGWSIRSNAVNGLQTSNGGGIGILVGCCQGGEASNNMIYDNRIKGEILVPEGDGGGYSAPGIVLTSDRRWGAPGGSLSDNMITTNKIELFNKYDSIPAVGIELTDMGLYEEPPVPDLTSNTVTRNDVRSVKGRQIALNPGTVSQYNTIDRNIGASSSSGVYCASVFGPQ